MEEIYDDEMVCLMPMSFLGFLLVGCQMVWIPTTTLMMWSTICLRPRLIMPTLWTVKPKHHHQRLMPNPYGSDLGQEWLELYNSGSTAVNLEFWSIQTASSSWKGSIFLRDLVIPAGGFVVIADHEGAAPQVDFVTDEPLSLGNADVGLDAVRLKSCSSEIKDTVLYGYVNGNFGEVEFLDDDGNQTFASFFEEPYSLARISDGFDSNDNAADFMMSTPTPGLSNLLQEEDDDNTQSENEVDDDEEEEGGDPTENNDKLRWMMR